MYSLQSSVMEEMNVDKMRVRDEQNVLKTKVNDTDARLESEIQNLRATIDEVRWETIKTVAGNVFDNLRDLTFSDCLLVRSRYSSMG
jgi:hypothetical protein